MKKSPRSSAAKVKATEQQNADSTVEGSPPSGTTRTAIRLRAAPSPPDEAGVLRHSKHGNTRVSDAKKTLPKLPHERDESIDTTGAIASEPMKQAARDIKRGLVDTDRGAEAGRTYQKLKQTQ
jgi:hypothetical protein